MKRIMILVDYVVQFAGRGMIVGTIFSSFIFSALVISSMLMSSMQPLHWLVIIPGGTLFGTLLGAMIGLIDGLLVGVIANAYLETCKALSGAVASISTFGLVIVVFYLIAAPSELFQPITIFFWVLAMLPVLIVAGVTGWDIAADNEEITKPRKVAA